MEDELPVNYVKPKKKRKKSKKRSNHKHLYCECIIRPEERHPVKNTKMLRHCLVHYCSVCGKVKYTYWFWYLPQFLREKYPNATSMPEFYPELTVFEIQECQPGDYVVLPD